MSLCSFQAPSEPWFPNINDKKEYWQFYNSIKKFKLLLDTRGTLHVKRYKRHLKEHDNVHFVVSLRELYISYVFFMLGYGSQYTQFCGAIDPWGLDKFDRDYRDGGEDDEGGCVWIERSRMWFTPRKAQIFM